MLLRQVFPGLERMRKSHAVAQNGPVCPCLTQSARRHEAVVPPNRGAPLSSQITFNFDRPMPTKKFPE